MGFEEQEEEYKDVNKLLRTALNRPVSKDPQSLRAAFITRCEKLDVAPSTAALEILNIEWRTLNGLLDGTQKRIDFTCLPKIARFIGVTYPEVIEMYLNSLDAVHQKEIGYTDKGKFIVSNFDLGNLKKAKI